MRERERERVCVCGGARVCMCARVCWEGVAVRVRAGLAVFNAHIRSDCSHKKKALMIPFGLGTLLF